MKNPNRPKCKKLCEKLKNKVHKVCDKPGLSCKGTDTDVERSAKKAALQTCLLTRKGVTAVCFRGRTEKGHDIQEEQTENRIKRCEELGCLY
ncbi:MAG: hypothetical protein KZQ99_11235 [Candidatus Thiodiazotropha sp. (ex Dulcina madagascariensis)]|nr:hypothetical protein [Candidatus Thiodiazotropha sp. (ex Dulcina madagascariensis)]